MIDISVSLGRLKLKNPTMLASGILGETAPSLLKVAKSGVAAIVTKSIGLHPREGYPNPSVVELGCGLLNAMGLPNPGVKEYRNEIKDVLKAKVPIIGSIFASSTEDFVRLAKKMESYGIQGLELNLSCPHAKGLGSDIGQDADSVYEFTKEVKKATEIPVFVKLTPNVTNIVEIAQAVEDGKGDGIVAINTVKAMAINIDIGKPILSNKIGGYSGPGIKPIGVRCVYEVAKSVKIPIIGVGGIAYGRDAIEYIMAGASAVQIGTAIHFRGLNVFHKICNEIEEFMKTHGYRRLREIVGIAVE